MQRSAASFSLWRLTVAAVLALGCASEGLAPMDATAEGVAPDDAALVDVTFDALSAEAAACGPGQVRCEGVCTDLTRDALHCGACGAACPATQTCSAGACACPSDRTLCGGTCVDLTGDPGNCAACGVSCSATEPFCVAGACRATCPSPLAACGGRCIDTARSASHCGACGNVCPAAQGCLAGACVSCETPGVDCGTRSALCDGICTGRSHVDWGLSCAFDCIWTGCQDDWADCDQSTWNGCEVSLLAGLSNCGACGNVCPVPPHATAGCSGGRCGVGQCLNYWANCDGDAANGCELYAYNDRLNCGACDRACWDGQTCMGVVCVGPTVTCPTGYENLDGNEANGCERILPPRPVAPLSTATTTRQAPRLTWLLASLTTGAQVQICADRACASVEQTLSVTSGSSTVPAPLTTGIHFWRLAGRSASGRVGTRYSPVWNFRVGARTSLAVDSSNGATLDVNGDGYGDLAIGAEEYDYDRGVVQVYPGGSGGLAATPTTTLTSAGLRDKFGSWVASAGDTNGDGFGDLIVGAPDSNGERGRAEVYLGSATGLATTPTWTVEGDVLSDTTMHYGQLVLGIGDANRDGYADVAVSGRGTTLSGTVRIYHGSATGLSTSPARTLNGTSADTNYDNFGAGLAAGDVNGDGYADLSVGVPRNHVYGMVRIYLGGSAGISATVHRTLSISTTEDFFGLSGAMADFNGDGYCDAAIGASASTTIWYGAATGIPTSPGTASFDGPGFSAGDVNRDGFADLGVNNSTNFSIWPGRSSGTFISAFQATTAEFRSGDALGDVNGDGYTDFVLFDRSSSAGTARRATVYRGAATRTNAEVLRSFAICRAGYADCDGDAANGCEARLDTHTQHCGACGNVCPASAHATAACRIGVCSGGTCSAGYANCDATGTNGCEVILLTDPSNCGACGRVCPTDQSCTNGVCAACTGSGMATCTGVCRDLANDVNHCGGCGVVCPAGRVCQGGACAVSCSAAGTTGCAGTCRNLSLDPYNCGTCGNTCLADQVCTAGTCVNASTTCSSGYDYLDGNPANGCSQIPTPRAIRPLAMATVSSQTPLLRWAMPRGIDLARVQVCSTRTCGNVEWSQDAEGGTVTVGLTLTPGIHWWRLRGRTNTGRFSTGWSPAWWFRVGYRSAPVNTSGGTTLDVNGDGYSDVAVGAPGYAGGGRVTVYLGSASGISTTPSVTLDPPTGLSRFGSSVASAGDVNGDGYGDLAVLATSQTLIYLGRSGTLPTSPATTITTGDSVASAGDVNGDGYADIIVGRSAAQVANIYLGSATGLPNTAGYRLSQDYLGFGLSVAGAGDVNGDGFDDILIGTYLDDCGTGRGNSGRVVLYLGSMTGLQFSPNRYCGSSDFFGYSVAGAGDVNGDGYADVLMSAYATIGYNIPYFSLYLGGTSGLSSYPQSMIDQGGTSLYEYGSFVAGAGDLDADGYADIVVGTKDTRTFSAPEWIRTGGRVNVYRGMPSGISETAWWTHEVSEQDVDYGASVGGVGDVNGDNYADILVGAPGRSRAYLYMSSPTGFPTSSVSATLGSGSAVSDEFGAAVVR